MKQRLVRSWWWSFCCRRPSSGRLSRVRELKKGEKSFEDVKVEVNIANSLWMLELIVEFPPIVVTIVGWWMLVVVGNISGLIVFTGSFTIIRGWVCFIWYCPLLFMLIMQFMFDCSMRLKSSCFIIDVEGMRGLTSFTIAVCCWSEARKLCCCCCCVLTSGTWCLICKFTELMLKFTFNFYQILPFCAHPHNADSDNLCTCNQCRPSNRHNTDIADHSKSIFQVLLLHYHTDILVASAGHWDLRMSSLKL